MNDIKFTNKPVISQIITMGDSLSDRGTLFHRNIFCCIPMAKITGLDKTSPQGRFTNGYDWCDNLGASFVNQFHIDDAEEYKCQQRKWNMDGTDISDDIISHRYSQPHCHCISQTHYMQSIDMADAVITSRYFKARLENSYTLDNNLYIQYKGRDFFRSYSEGGLTSHSYRGLPSKNINCFFTRLIVPTLSDKRKKLIQYDKDHAVSVCQKQHTLIMEWSGANDLITVNTEPTIGEADKAVKSRLENVEALIKRGYHHFYLFDLPDISLTPRYQNKAGEGGDKERQNARDISDYFNNKLQAASDDAQEKHPDCMIKVMKCSKAFTDIYNDAKRETHKYPGHLDKDKLTTAYITSKDFINKNGLSPASGYMFWDSIHPSADMHALLADKIYEELQDEFIFRVNGNNKY